MQRQCRAGLAGWKLAVEYPRMHWRHRKLVANALYQRGMSVPGLSLTAAVFVALAGWPMPQPDPGIRPWICLNGEWQFQPADDKLTFPPGDRWDPMPIRIPSPWNVNAFTRGDGGDFVCFPSYPRSWEDVRAAWHRRRFRVPENCRGKRVFLRFEAVHYWADVYVNGRKVGSHEGGFTPFEFDITDAVRFGVDNELIVGVKDRRFFDVNGRTPYGWGSFWGEVIRGIWQDVYVLARPQIYVRDPFVHYSLADRTLHIEATVVNASRRAARCQIGATIYPWQDGKWRQSDPAQRLAAAPVDVPAGGKATVRLEARWPDAKLWWPEEPNLYVAAIGVSEPDRATIDELAVRFGCKEFKIGPRGKFLLNGRTWTGRGDAWHFMGIPQMTPDFARLWYSMAKSAHINIIRLHAQVYPEYYLDVADEMGMLIVDETAIWGSAGNLYLGDGFRRRALTHIREFVLRDRNHPSVALWSVANEIGWVRPEGAGVKSRDEIYRLFADLAAEIKKLDPTREVSCDGDHDLGGRLAIYSLHYPGPGRPRAKAKIFTIGESGQMFYSRPPLCSYRLGETVYLSNNDRLEAVGLEMADLIEGYRQWAAYATPFNVQWYGLEPLPFDLKFDWPRLDTPGVKPERIGPFCSGLNAWHDAKLPDFVPNPVYWHVADAFVPVRFFIRDRSVSAYAPGRFVWPVAVHNDTMQDRRLELRWELKCGRRHLAAARKQLALPAGEWKVVEMALRLPSVARHEQAISVMELREGQRQHYVDRRTVHIYPRQAAAECDVPVAVVGGQQASRLAKAIAANNVEVFGKPRELRRWLRQARPNGVVVLAADAKLSRADQRRLLEAVERGVRVLDLAPAGRLAFAGAPGDGWVRQTFRLAFAKDLAHPLMRDVAPAQLCYWRPDGTVASAAWRGVPPRPMTPLVTCGDGYAAVLDVPIGRGRVVACCLRLAEAAEVEPAARALLRNAVAWLAMAKPRELVRPAVFPGRDAAARMALYALGLCEIEGAGSSAQADAARLVVVSAAALADQRAAAAARQCLARGGTVLVLGATGATAGAVGQLSGTEIKAARADAVQLVPAPGKWRDPLLAGLDLADLYWLNDKHQQVILPWSIQGRGEALLVNNRLDWRRWVQRGENFKPGSIKRSELEPYEQKVGLMRLKSGEGHVIVSTIPLAASSTKSMRVLAQLLTNLGADWRARRLNADQRAAANLRGTGAVVRWMTLGPVRGRPWQELYRADLLGGEASARPALGQPACGGTWVVRDFPPVADLSAQELFGQLSDAAMYFAVYLHVPTARQALLLVGSDDDVKIWLNGRLVHANSVARPVKPDEDKVGPVALQAGWNLLLAKVVNRTGHWGLSVRVVAPDGQPFPDISLAADDPALKLREISPEGWQARSNPPGDTAAAFDRRRETRWTSGKPMDDTMWFELDMGKVHSVRRIVLNSARSPGDWPRGLVVEISLDGRRWREVFRCADGNRIQAGGVTYIMLAPTQARYIRLRQTGPEGCSGGLWWSIHELRVYE